MSDTEHGVERRTNVSELCFIHGRELTELHKAIYGNGNVEAGLVWIAKENRVMIRELQEFVATFKKNAWKIGWFLFSAGMAAMGSFVVSVARLLVEHWQH